MTSKPSDQVEGNWTPRPDPTTLTTAALLRENAALREVLVSRMDGQRDVIDARLAGMDKAITLLQTITDRQPLDMDRKVANLERLHKEKFDSIQTQFQERDTRVEQTAQAGRVELSAALQAAKEAVGAQQQSNTAALTKQETATKEQINALITLMQQNTETTDVKITSLQSRMDRGEGQGKGRGDVWGYVIAGAMFLLALAALFRGHV